MKSIAIDITGLAWRYRTGVQNLYWAFVNAYSQNTMTDKPDILFYDRNGLYNKEIAALLGKNYFSIAPSWCHQDSVKLFKSIGKRINRNSKLNLNGKINHVWNWDIYHQKKAQASITIPDILPIEYPQWFDNSMIETTHKSLIFAQDEADYIFCISDYIKDRVVMEYKIDANRIKVVYPGIDQSFFCSSNDDAISTFLKKYDLPPKQYLLSSGFIDPRKNLLNQLLAFEKCVQETKTNIKYAITGIETSLSGDVIDIIKKPFFRDHVVFLGYVSRQELKQLMSGSLAVMYCSLAEGFGLPIIEAMASKTLVITSNTTSMKEIATNRAILVEPNDIYSIVEGINEAITLRNNNLDNIFTSNYLYSKQFTIENWLNNHIIHYQ